MASTPLLFERQPATTAHLLFGDDGGAIADIPVRVALVLPAPTPLVWAIKDNEASVAVTLPSPTVAAHLTWDSNTYRPTVAKNAGVYQRAIPGLSPTVERYQRTALLPIGLVADYERAWPLQAGQVGRYSTTLQAPQSILGVYQRAGPHGGLLCSSHFDSALHLPTGLISLYQRALGLQTWLVQQRYQEAMRVRCDTRQRYQRAWPLARGYGSGMGQGVALLVALQAIYQRAWPPRPGMWDGGGVEPPKKPPCYTPNGHLIFSAPPNTNISNLLFYCPGKIVPVPQGQLVIPVLRVYMTVHTLTATMHPSGEPVPLRDVTIVSDDDSFGWSLSANGTERLFAQLAPVGGLPVKVRVAIDGIEWIFAIESLTRSRKFAGNTVSLQGRSTTALLGEPYLPISTWGNQDADYTAQQLVAQALEYTGTDIDWGITDWLVPQDAWSYQGTPLAVAMRIAESVGAVLRSHRTDHTLIFAPRYPAMPWEWDATPADIIVPSAVIATDSIAPNTRPAWNAVYVTGTNWGVLGHTRITGTAGDLLAPQITDGLITHVDAARQRGRAILGNGGKQLRQTITAPLVLSSAPSAVPVLLAPGNLIQVNELTESYKGLVRSISISASLPTVRQTIQIERHL